MSDTLPKSPEGMESGPCVTMIPDVPWFVSLKIAALKIAARDRTSRYIPDYEREYPEAVYDTRQGVEPDPKYVERRMRELNPHLFVRAK